jgi:hypothetical protein
LQARKKAKRLLTLKKELALLDKTNTLSKHTNQDCQERLKGLEMQLNTVMLRRRCPFHTCHDVQSVQRIHFVLLGVQVTIKIAETGENRKNYELNIAHLKEEDFEHFNQLRALRKQNQVGEKYNRVRLCRAAKFDEYNCCLVNRITTTSSRK